MRTLVLVLIMSSSLVVACGDGSPDGEQGMDGMTAPNPVTATEPSMLPGSSMMSPPSPMTAAPMLQRKPSQHR